MDGVFCKYGPRCCKRKDDVSIDGLDGKGRYFGELSKSTNKPNGRGVFVSKTNLIHIGFFKNGKIDEESRWL